MGRALMVHSAKGHNATVAGERIEREVVEGEEHALLEEAEGDNAPGVVVVEVQ